MSNRLNSPCAGRKVKWGGEEVGGHLRSSPRLVAVRIGSTSIDSEVDSAVGSVRRDVDPGAAVDDAFRLAQLRQPQGDDQRSTHSTCWHVNSSGFLRSAFSQLRNCIKYKQQTCCEELILCMDKTSLIYNDRTICVFTYANNDWLFVHKSFR